MKYVRPSLARGSVIPGAGARCLFAKTLDALGAGPDAAYADPLEPGLLYPLAFGRWPAPAV